MVWFFVGGSGIDAGGRCANPHNFADPNITVDSIQAVFRAYMDCNNTSDLWSLVGPPPGSPKDLTWKTPVHPGWLVKTLGVDV